MGDGGQLPLSAAHVRALPPSTMNCSAPLVTVDQQSIGISTATVQVTAPSTVPDGGWEKYSLTVCAVSPAGGCRTQDCSPVLAPPAPTSCALTGLSEETTYSVQAEAAKGSLTSLNSTSQILKTLAPE